MLCEFLRPHDNAPLPTPPPPARSSPDSVGCAASGGLGLNRRFSLFTGRHQSPDFEPGKGAVKAKEAAQDGPGA